MDVRKEISFCRKVGLRVLGVVENMSEFVCPKCHKSTSVLPSTSGGAERLARESGAPMLGRVPLDPRVGRACDEGRSVFEEDENPIAKAYRDILDKLRAEMGSESMETS